jgi:putative SOS response-associated peptidase YedK
MCYDAATMVKRAKAYAERIGTQKAWEEAKSKVPPFYHLSGFDEPDLPVLLKPDPDKVHFFQWGFVPMVYAPQIKGRPMNTLNARNDKIFTHRSIYRESAEQRRCIVVLDGFFDHHKKNGIAYPYYVKLKSQEPLLVGGLWQTFVNQKDEIELNTVTLITGPANKEMAWIHNEPAYSPDSRMIFILNKGDEDQWINGTNEEASDQ